MVAIQLVSYIYSSSRASSDTTTEDEKEETFSSIDDSEKHYANTLPTHMPASVPQNPQIDEPEPPTVEDLDDNEDTPLVYLNSTNTFHVYSKLTVGPWFSLDDFPPHQWRSKLHEFGAWIDLKISRPDASLQEVIKEFTS